MAAFGEVEFLAEGLKFPESPFWSEKDGCLYLVEWIGDRILSLQGTWVETLFCTQAGDGPSGLCQDLQGNLWATLYTSRKLARFSCSGERLLVVADYHGLPFRGPCDLVGDATGGVFFTDSGDFEEDWETGRPAGVVYHCSLTGELTEIDRGLCFPNGIALSPDQERLYVNEHRQNRTLEYTLRADRSIARKKVLFRFDQNCLLEADAAFELGPDGLCVDNYGNLWIAHYGGGKLLQVSPGGELLSTFWLPRGRRPTNVAFHAQERSLYITEAEYGLLFRVKLDI